MTRRLALSLNSILLALGPFVCWTEAFLLKIHSL